MPLLSLTNDATTELFLSLPNDGLADILSFVGPADAAHICMTCTRLRDFSVSPQGNHLWRTFIRREFPLFPVGGRKVYAAFKEYKKNMRPLSLIDVLVAGFFCAIMTAYVAVINAVSVALLVAGLFWAMITAVSRALQNVANDVSRNQPERLRHYRAINGILFQLAVAFFRWMFSESTHFVSEALICIMHLLIIYNQRDLIPLVLSVTLMAVAWKGFT